MNRYTLLVGVVICSAIGGARSSVFAQQRFVPIGHDPVAVVPGLQIVTLRDNAAQNACYEVWVVEPPVAAAQPASPAAVDAAAQLRDQRMQALSAEFDRAQYTPAPGIPSNVLALELEAQKAQSDFNRVVLDYHFSRMEEFMAQLARGSRIAVSGPSPCPASGGAREDDR